MQCDPKSSFYTTPLISVGVQGLFAVIPYYTIHGV